MGKLHRIRRAFDKLPHEQKVALAQYGGGSYGGSSYGPPYFGIIIRSHKNYVKKLCDEYTRGVALCN